MKQWVLILCLFLPWPSVQAAKYALLIGVGQYKEQGISWLSGPKNDVEALSEVLMQRWDFPERRIVTLVDQQATRNRILAELERLATQTQPDDVVLLYFSGHGASRGSLRADQTSQAIPEHTGAWIPYDYPAASGSPRQQVDHLIIGQRDLRPILERLDQGRRRVYLISDSCYSGEVFRGAQCAVGVNKSSRLSAAVSDQWPTFPNQDLTYPYHHVVFLSAAGAGEPAWDLRETCLSNFPTRYGKAHGAFTDALLRALDGSLPGVDRNGDGQISHDELFHIVREFMDQRRYPHTPQGRPMVSDRQAAQVLPLSIFSSGQAPPAQAPPAQAPVDTTALRVEVPGSLAAWRAPLADLAHLTLAGPPFDLTLQSAGSHLRILSSAGEEITRVPAENRPVLVDTLQHQAQLKRLLATMPVREGQRVTLDLHGQPGGSRCVGESYTLAVGTEQPAYLVILDLFPQGQTSVLYPFNAAELKRHPARSVTRIPDDGSRITVTCPCGEDILVALAFPEVPQAIRPLLGAQTIEPGSALQPHLQALWQEAKQRAAWSFLRLMTTGKCPPTAVKP